ncbi:MAG TPA: D-glycero-beta-D-manno-heptose 1-phosphate adenylyltransferase [Planctomycetota bacterium]|jgi:D-beta-D-heptose 7-phosphate kinase/D-beta-D-heptose 1-phosphate adenosyltransferase
MFNEPDRETVKSLLAAMAGRRVCVIGDAMLDSYLYGSASRLSPEAPVQVVQVEREEYLLGGAANVAKCLVGLGAKVSLCAIVGTDSLGQQFLEEAKSLGIDTSLVFQDSCRPTPVKTRIVSGRQHLLRVDRERRTAYPAALLAKIAAKIKDAVAAADAVLLSDYDKGLLTDEVCEAAIKAAVAPASVPAGRDAGTTKPVLVDPKGQRWQRYSGATVLKPNWREGLAYLATRDSMVMTLSPHADDEHAQQIAAQLRAGVGVKAVLLTRGEHGASLVWNDSGKDGAAVSFRARAAQVQDEAGAGDVVAAVATLALAAGADLPTAAWLANVAAGAKVGKFGTQTVSDHEILEALGERFPSFERKVMTKAQAAEFGAAQRNAGKKVVFTNGCFDILHLGHVTLLEAARRLGDALIVGINTDASIRRLKGPERPVQNENDRARILAAQGCVDGVVLFAEDTPCELLKAIRPDVLCKGADYQTKQGVVGWEIVESYGGRIALIDVVAGRSTSKIIEKSRDKKEPPEKKEQPKNEKAPEKKSAKKKLDDKKSPLRKKR